MQNNNAQKQSSLNTNNQQKEWSINSWEQFEINQFVDYENKDILNNTILKLKSLPPLVTPHKIFNLKKQLEKCAKGEAFLLQGGDCAELFKYCTKSNIEDKLKVILQMSLVIVLNAKVPVVRIARIAGQYAKPRTNIFEYIDGKEYNSFRGDIINSNNIDNRKPDPNRLLDAYFHSSATLNYMNSILQSGFADLRNSENWEIGHIKNNELKKEYENLLKQLNNALGLMDLIGITNNSDNNENFNKVIKEVEIYTSHEAMLLQYESALTRKIDSIKDKNMYYNGSAHFLWVGDRTRQLNGAHVEYLSGICNPIGIKIGPTSDIKELIEVIKKLNKTNEIGKITLITRFGAELVDEKLPPLIKKIKESNLNVVWICDPMHGNTETFIEGNKSYKTRKFNKIFLELKKSFEIHKSCESRLNGVHLELTGDLVTECLGGFGDLKDLRPNYETLCDPRLNYEQSMDVAFLISKYFKENSEYYINNK